LSPLAIHTRNLEQDPRASLVVQMPGWSGEANARITMFGDIHVLPERMQAPAVEIFTRKRSHGAYSERWGNFTYWRCACQVVSADVWFSLSLSCLWWHRDNAHSNRRNVPLQDVEHQ
jgi:hypothetical protein